MMGAGSPRPGTCWSTGWAGRTSTATTRSTARPGAPFPRSGRQDGEAAFRAEESRVLAAATTSDGPVVIAVAGGAVLDPGQPGPHPPAPAWWCGCAPTSPCWPRRVGERCRPPPAGRWTGGRHATLDRGAGPDLRRAGRPRPSTWTAWRRPRSSTGSWRPLRDRGSWMRPACMSSRRRPRRPLATPVLVGAWCPPPPDRGAPGRCPPGRHRHPGERAMGRGRRRGAAHLFPRRR